MKKKNLKSLFDFAQENNTAEMDEMLRVSLKGGCIPSVFGVFKFY